MACWCLLDVYKADDAVLAWMRSYAEVGASLVVYRVSLAADRQQGAGAGARHAGAGPGHGNASLLAAATYHDSMLALYECARARWLDTSGDSCQCMTDRNDFLATLSRVSALLPVTQSHAGLDC